MNETILKYFLILYFILYYGVLFVINSYIVYKRTGKNPYVLGKNPGILCFTEKGIKLTGIIIPFVLITYIFFEEVYRYLIPIFYLETTLLDFAGMLIMLIGFVICYTAQLYMRNSWKIGIDKEAETILVTTGIFKFSRNPFFLGSLISYTGLFLILPNIITFSIGIAYYILIQIQVRLEEENLNKTLGNSYQDYCAKVKRWI